MPSCFPFIQILFPLFFLSVSSFQIILDGDWMNETHFHLKFIENTRIMSLIVCFVDSIQIPFIRIFMSQSVNIQLCGRWHILCSVQFESLRFDCVLFNKHSTDCMAFFSSFSSSSSLSIFFQFRIIRFYVTIKNIIF